METLSTIESLVEGGERHFGRFAKTPIANPFDATRGPTLAYDWFRTKEWVGFTLIHHDLASSMIIQDAKYLATSEFYIFDRHEKDLFQYSANRIAHPLHLPSDLLHDSCTFASSAYGVGYSFELDQVRVVIDIAATKTAPAVKGRLSLDSDHASPPLVVSARMPDGGTMYTNKIVYPVSGVIVCGERRYVFNPKKDFAILDEHKSRLPYRTDWTWGTFAMPVTGGITGANLAIRPALEGEQEECCIWTPTAAEPLADVSFTPLGDDDLSPWHIASEDGRVDVTFTPEGHKAVNQNLLVAQIEYAQWYGHYDGILQGADKAWSVKGVPGVVEKMHARL